MKRTHLITTIFALLCFVGASAVAIADSEAAAYNTLLKDKSQTIVSVKAVLTTEIRMMGQSQDEESRIEVPGVVVSDDGLVLLSNLPFSSDRIEQAIGGMGMPMAPDIHVSPSDIKVLFEGDDEEYDAFFVATDSELDLAFIQIEKLGDREVSPVDFESGERVDIGDRIYSVTRLDRGFDYAAHVQSGRVSGQITRPRRAWLVDGSLNGLGLPVYTADGELAGVLTTLASMKADDPDAASGLGRMMRMLGGDQDTGFRNFVIPPRMVRGVINSASERAKEVLEERAGD